ncbi:MAG: hypothetical protein C0594_13595 [Marinilabiliales bacterium]|nr:MAG: hypothetical protein C0594_13595 [Marinilabiliales bacterium]
MEIYFCSVIKTKEMKTITFIAAVILTIGTTFSSFAENIKDNNNSEAPVANAMITGKVVDQATGEALAGVAIKLNEDDVVVYTYFEGNFTIENPAAGQVDITADFISYESKHLKEISVKSQKNTIRVELKPVLNK